MVITHRALKPGVRREEGGYRASTGLWIGIYRTDLSSTNSFRWYDGSTMTNPQQYFCSGEPQNSEYAGAFWSQTYCLEDFSYNWNGASGWWDVFHVVCSLNTCQDAEYSTDSGVTCLPRSTCSASQYQFISSSTSSLYCYDTTSPGSACYYTSDVTCRGLTVCTSSQFQLQAPTTTTDRVCQTFRTCGVGSEVKIAGNATIDVTCGQCALGYIDSDSSGSTPCVQCPAGTGVSSTGRSGLCSQYTCAAGTSDIAANAQSCTACLPGTYMAAGSSGPCQYCGLGTTDHDSSPSTPCQTCSAGTAVTLQGATGACSAYQCIAGTSDEDNISATPCTACSAGSHAPTGSAGSCSLLRCAPGTIDSDSLSSTPCTACSAPGLYVPVGSAGSCTAFGCAAGTVDLDRSSATPCVACGPGNYSAAGTAGTCPACAAGTTDHDSNAATACVACGQGTYVPQGSIGACSFFQCTAGTSDEDNNPTTPCTACPTGSYAPTGSAGSCSLLRCAAGTIDSDSLSSTPCSACSAPGLHVPLGSAGSCASFSCTPGTVDQDSSSATPCAQCLAVGLYVPASSSGNCSLYPCQPGTLDGDNNSATVCSTCPPGTELTRQGLSGSCSVYACSAGMIDSDNNTSTACVACPTGVYVPPGQSGSCTAFGCAAGTVDLDRSSATPCVACGPGNYSAAGTAGTCPACAAGTTDHDSNAATACVACGPGTYVPQGSIGACSTFQCFAGTSDNDINPTTPCVVCPAGSYAPVGSVGPCSLLRCAAGTIDSDILPSTPCVACSAPGQYVPVGSAGNCSAFGCAAGTVDLDSSSATPCVTCGPGNYSAAGTAGPCTTCVAGTTDHDRNAATPCVACGPGTFTRAGSLDPCSSHNCSAATTDDDFNSATPCITCAPGAYAASASVGSCMPCPAGTTDFGNVLMSQSLTIAADLNPATPCVSCPSGSYTPANSTGTCLNCPAGQTDDDSSPATPCLPCPVGSFEPAGSNGSCALFVCGDGSTDHDFNPATACIVCGLGYSINIPNASGPCSTYACPAGSVGTDSMSQLSCVPCLSGSYAPVGSASACQRICNDQADNVCSQLRCPAGTTDDDSDPATPCVSCPAGAYAPGSSSGLCSAFQCPLGFFDDDSDSSTPCISCPPQTYAAYPGANSCVPARPCVAPEWERAPPTPTSDRWCSDAVQYCSVYAPDEHFCQKCNDGRHSPPESNTTVCAVCPIGSGCKSGVRSLCSQGTYQNSTQQSACLNCSTGFYAPNTSMATCLACPLTAFAASAGQSTCQTIDVGFYGVSLGVSPLGNTQQRLCPAGAQCVAGQRRPCSAGTFQTARGATACLECGAGRYGATTGMLVTCPLIPAGYYGLGGNSTTRTGIQACEPGSSCIGGVKTPCTPGWYQDASASSACRECGLGSYSSDAGRSTACWVAAPGQSLVGGSATTRTSAVPCLAGFSCMSGVQQACATGQFQSQPGQAQCQLCSLLCALGLSPLGTCNVTSGVPDCVDITPPTVALRGSASLTLELGSIYNELGADGTDAYSGVCIITISAAPNMMAVGTYNVIYTANDAAGNIGRAVRVVVVADTVPPALTVLGRSPVTVMQGETYTDAGAVASDLGGPIDVVVTGLPINTSIAQDVLLTYTAIDNEGLRTQATRSVFVLSRVVETLALTQATIAYQAATAQGTDAANASVAAYALWGGRQDPSVVLASVSAKPSTAAASSGSSIVLVAAVAAIVVLVAIVLVVIRRKYKAVPINPAGPATTSARPPTGFSHWSTMVEAVPSAYPQDDTLINESDFAAEVYEIPAENYESVETNPVYCSVPTWKKQISQREDDEESAWTLEMAERWLFENEEVWLRHASNSELTTMLLQQPRGAFVTSLAPPSMFVRGESGVFETAIAQDDHGFHLGFASSQSLSNLMAQLIVNPAQLPTGCPTLAPFVDAVPV